jgi:hypothetical protein
MALRNFDYLIMEDNQTLLSFNQRFNKAYSIVTARGLSLTPEHQFRNYFNAIGRITNVQLAGIIALYRHQFMQGKLKMSVFELQSLFQQEEERILMQERVTMRGFSNASTPTPKTRRSGANATSANTRKTGTSNNTQSKSIEANATATKPNGKKPAKPQRNKIVCWGCREVGHNIYKCPTTSETDRVRIIDEQRRKLAEAKVTTSTTSSANATSSTTTPVSSSTTIPGKSYAAATKVSFLNAISSQSGNVAPPWPTMLPTVLLLMTWFPFWITSNMRYSLIQGQLTICVACYIISPIQDHAMPQ